MAYKKILKALYDYEADADDELNFSEGDLLGVIRGDETADEEDDGWYYGCNVMNQSEVNGFIPKTYCEELNGIENVRSTYEYPAQEENELSFGEGQILMILHRIDEDWWLACDEERKECGMVPANYFRGKEDEEASDEAETEFAVYEKEPAFEEPVYEEHYEEPTEDHSFAPVNMFAPPPPPPPMPQIQQVTEIPEAEQPQSNPVEEIENSSALKLKCNALFLDSKYTKTKGQLMLERALYLCNNNSIEHCFDLSELRDYDAIELKLTLNSGEKIAIGLGKKDAKRMAELVHEVSGYEAEEEVEVSAPPALPRAPIVVGPKMPESTTSTESKTEAVTSNTKTPMVVGVSFEGLEGEEISIFEGEEVYLLLASSDDNKQFARIEKINGVQGIVPRNFLMSRSEYQKQKENEIKMGEMRIEQEKEVKMPSLEYSKKGRSDTINKPSRSNSINTPSSIMGTVARNAPSEPSNAWSALASGSSIPVSTPSQSTSSVKLENSRLWKDKSGKFQVEAEFVSLKDGKVTIVKASGSQVSVPLDVLSERDVEFACRRAGVPVPKKATNSTIVKGFDWLAFFLSVGIEAGKAKLFGEKFASESFEESLISAFTSEFLGAQGMEMTDIYKLLPEAAKRKAQMMQASAKEKHRSNNSQMVLSSETNNNNAGKSTLVPFKSEKSLSVPKSQAHHQTTESSVQIQSFPTIEELEAQGAIELTPSKSQVTLPGGIQVSSNQFSSDDNTKILVQPIIDSKERSREVIGADGSSAKEYTRISTSTTMVDGAGGNNAIALLQQQMQNNAMMQAQAQASAQVQMQMRMQAQAQAQAQMQMQMRAQAQAQYAQQQAQAQYAQQQRMYQHPQQQQQQPAVHITIHTGDKSSQMNPMTPPMSVMNQPMMQMNGMNNGMNSGMNNGMNGMMNMGQMGNMGNMGNVGQMVPANPMMMMNPQSNNVYNPFDPTSMPPNPFYPNNNGFGF